MGALSRSGASSPSWVDNVVRRREFEAANPEVTISFEKQAACGADWGRWTGVIVVGDEERTVTAHELGALLSRLVSGDVVGVHGGLCSRRWRCLSG
ncbi:MAG TPA: hypothetical protein VF070_25475 [Streptosporangiaceae bacterium]